MGTAIVGVAASLNPGGIASLAPAARTLSQAMVVLAAVLAVVLAVPTPAGGSRTATPRSRTCAIR